MRIEQGRQPQKTLNVPLHTGLLEPMSRSLYCYGTGLETAPPPSQGCCQGKGREYGGQHPARCLPQPVPCQNLPLPRFQSPVGPTPGKMALGAGPCKMGKIWRGGRVENHTSSRAGGQTHHRYLNWLASEMFIAHLHIWRLFHLSNSSDCFTLWEWRTERA